MYQRLKDVLEYLKNEKIVYNQQDFVIRLGDNPSSVSEMLRGKRPIGYRFIQRLCKTFPMISSNWVKDGSGEMVVEGVEIIRVTNGLPSDRAAIESEIYRLEVERLRKANELLHERIGALEHQLFNKRGNPI